MTALLIADVHLSEAEPALTAGFVEFLRTEARQAQSLYILGDLFAFWIGDDETHPLAMQVANELNSLTQQGVACYFVHGNRDFLLQSRFAARCGMTILPEESLLTLGKHKILILHGDTLCTDDLAYQRFRRIVNQRWLQRIFLCLPRCLRYRIAKKLRHQSRESQHAKNALMMDVNPTAVTEALARHHTTVMVHGHTHKLGWHTLLIDGAAGARIVLGDWHTSGSYVRVTPSDVSLIEFPLMAESPVASDATVKNRRT